MRHPPEVHGINFFSATDLQGRPLRIAIGAATNGNVALALLREGEQLIVDDGTTVAHLAPTEVPGLQRHLGDAMMQAVQLRD